MLAERMDSPSSLACVAKKPKLVTHLPTGVEDATVGETEPATRQQPAEKTVEEPLTSGMAPRFTKLLTDILATEGDQVVLECCVGGDPHPDIRWFLNNHEIVSTDGIQ
ncbi:unnamed protein product, partial [Timema podura]|nr:unnamed protein product [Timema podura]